MRGIWLATALGAALGFACQAVAAEDVPAVVQLATDDIVVQANGLFSHTSHLEILAKNDAAAAQIGQQEISFSESMEDVDIVEAYTLKADGRKIAVNPSSILTQQPRSQGSQFDDVRQKAIVFPDMAGGDSMVYTVRFRAKKPRLPGYFGYSDFFARTVAYNEVRETITVPKSFPLKIETHEVEFQKRESGDTITYSWHYSAPNPLPDDEAPQISPRDRLPRFVASSFQDYDELGRAYASIAAAKSAVTPKVQALADSVTTGISDRRLQAQKIYEWVSKNVRYVAVDIGNGGLVPHDAGETLENRYGDCKDHAVLFAALLKAKRIDSEVVLVNADENYSLPDAPMFTNHAITWLPEFKLYADTTATVAPFGTLPFEEYGKPVIHAVPSGKALRQIPVLATDAATISTKTTARFVDGKVTGESTVTAAGPLSLPLRGIAVSVQTAGSARLAAASLQEHGLTGTGSFEFSPPTELSPDYTMKTQFSFDPPSDWLSGSGFAMVRGISVSDLAGDFLMGPLFDDGLKDTEDTACFSGRHVDEFSLAPPPDKQFERVPQDFHVKTANLEFTAKWALDGETMTLRHEFVSRMDQPLCTGAIRKETAGAFRQIRDYYSASLVSLTAPGMKDKNIIDDGVAALRRGETDDAISLFSRAIENPNLTRESHVIAVFDRALAYQQKGQNDAAIADFTAALRLKPDFKEALSGRGGLYGQLRQFSKAVADLTRLIRLDGQNPVYYRTRGLAYAELRKYQATTSDLTTVIRLLPGDHEAYARRAEIYARRGLYDRAIADCDSAMRLGRKETDCHAIRATADYMMAHFDDAISDANVAIGANANDWLAYFNRGLAYLATGQYDLAIADFENSRRTILNNSIFLPASIYGRGVAKQRLGNQQEGQDDIAAAVAVDRSVTSMMLSSGVVAGDYQSTRDDLKFCREAEAKGNFEQATVFCFRSTRDGKLGPEDKALAYLSLGLNYFGTSESEAAVEAFDNALMLDPTLAPAFIWRGASYADINPERAMRDFDEGIRLDSKSAIAYERRADAHMRMDDHDAAMRDLDRSLALDPDLYPALVARGRLYVRQKDDRRALRDFDAAAKARPDFSSAYLERAIVYDHEGDIYRAVREYGEAIRRNPNSAQALNDRCYALAKLGRAAEALADCDEALSLEPDAAEVLDSRGYAYLRLAQYDLAIADYDSALQLDPQLGASLYGRGVAKLKSGRPAEGNADIAAAKAMDPNVAAQVYGVTP